MATYPTAPSRRMAFDDDGTVLFKNSVGVPVSFCRTIRNYAPWFGYNELVGSHWSEQSQSFKNETNDEDASTHSTYSTNYTYCDSGMYQNILFPQKRELDGYYINLSNVSGHGTYYSYDTTNGLDGTWINAGWTVLNSGTSSLYRTNITSTAINGIRGIRITHYSGSESIRARVFHFYGSISPGESPDRLLFLNPSDSDATFSDLVDYGDFGIGAIGASRDTQIKVKNNSGSKTAHDVTLTAEDLGFGSGSWFTFSADGVSFSSSLTFSSLSPGQSQPVYVRASVPAGQSGLKSQRLQLSAGGWD